MEGNEGAGADQVPAPVEKSRRPLLPLLAGLLVLLLLPFVQQVVTDLLGGGGDPPTAIERVAGAGGRTAQAGTVRVETSMATTAAGSDVASSTIRGTVSFEDGSGVMEADLDAFGGSGRGRTVTAVRSGNMLYVTTPRIAEVAPGARPWLVVDASGAADGSWQRDLEELDTVDGTGEITSAIFLATFFFGSTNEMLVGGTAGLVEDVREVGRERVKGAPTTHYEVTLKQDAVMSQLSDDLRGDIAAASADAWVDEKGRLRRYRFNIRTAPGLPSQAASTHEFFDFGVTVDARRPPVGETGSPKDLLEAHARAQRP